MLPLLKECRKVCKVSGDDDVDGGVVVVVVVVVLVMMMMTWWDSTAGVGRPPFCRCSRSAGKSAR